MGTVTIKHIGFVFVFLSGKLLSRTFSMLLLCFCLGVSVGLGRLACFSWWTVILDNTLVNDCSLHLSYCVTQVLLKLDLFIISLL